MKQIFITAIALFAFIYPCSAQGVKQLWGTDPTNSRLYSIDTATAIFTERKTFSNNEGASPIDFKLVNGKIYGTLAYGWFLYVFDPLTGYFEGKVPKETSNEGQVSTGIVHHLTANNNNLYLLSDMYIRATPVDEDAGTYDYEYSHIGKWNTGTQHFDELIPDNFTAIGGLNGPLVEFNNKFYGLTSQGGNTINGFIYEWTPDNTFIIQKADLPNTSMRNSGYPGEFKALTVLNDQFYFASFDHLFKWDPQSNNTPEILHTFSDDGAGTFSHYQLIQKNGKLYGVIRPGEGNESDIIFEWDPEGSGSYIHKKNP